MARDILNNVPTGWLLVAATVVAIGIVLLTVLVILRLVPATREGHHVEISAPMHGIVAALFGLFLAFCHHHRLPELSQRRHQHKRRI